MADWYVSSASYFAIPQWQANTAYSIGQFVRATAPTLANMSVYRCTSAGTSGATEPTWSSGDGNTTTSGGAIFTSVGGRSTYGWSAAAGSLLLLSNNSPRAMIGDRVFVASDHSESSAAGVSYAFNNGLVGIGLVQLFSVNRAGAVPPGVGDLVPGATIACAGSMVIEAMVDNDWEGFTFALTGSASVWLYFGSSGSSGKTNRLRSCAIRLNSGAGTRISTNNPTRVVLDNTTVQFGDPGQGFQMGYAWELAWNNTPNALVGGVIPTTLFCNVNSACTLATLRGVDLSMLTTALLQNTSGWSFSKLLFDGCKIAPGVARHVIGPSTTSELDEVELIGVFDGSNFLNERYTAMGALTTDRSTTMVGGAADDVGLYSMKLVSNTRANAIGMLNSFWLDVENVFIGSTRQATIELISSAALTSADLRLVVEYQGTAGSSVASFIDSVGSLLNVATTLVSSTVTWNNPPATPVKQRFQLIFTPQTAGRVRARLGLCKPSTTVWINPQILVT